MGRMEAVWWVSAPLSSKREAFGSPQLFLPRGEETGEVKLEAQMFSRVLFGFEARVFDVDVPSA